MINKRKKKPTNIKSRIFDTQYTESNYDADMDASPNITKVSGFDPSTLGGPLKGLAEGQMNKLQTQLTDREDAEESNLDILDRGSRYKRKNEKLKKFKV